MAKPTPAETEGVRIGFSHTRPFRFAAQAFEARSGKEWTDIARRAEALGYSTLFTTDHYFGPGAIAESSGHRPVDVAPIAAMIAAAIATTELRVGCRVFNVDLHQPVVLAKELATLDLVRMVAWRSVSGQAGLPPSTRAWASPWTGRACASPASVRSWS